jgi:hypothetical protein
MNQVVGKRRSRNLHSNSISKQRKKLLKLIELSKLSEVALEIQSISELETDLNSQNRYKRQFKQLCRKGK